MQISTRRATALIAPFVLAAALAFTATPAGAVNRHHVATSTTAGAAAPSPRSTASFSGGWQEHYDADGNLVNNGAFTGIGITPGTGSGFVVMGARWSGGPNSIEFRSSPGPFVVGQTYWGHDGATVAGVCAQDDGWFTVDQIGMSGKNVVSVGIQYDVVCDTGDEYIGAIAVNLVNDPGQGYYLYDNIGLLQGFGNDEYLCYLGDLSAADLNAPIIDMAVTPDGGGYWMLGSDGGIFTYGNATFYGSTGNIHLNQPIVAMARTPDGAGYWLVAADGGIFSYGDAKFYGSTGNITLNKPIVGMTATSDGKGYWLVASDGGIFSFGDAKFYGSTGNLNLNKPIVGMAPSPDGGGYWFVASDGGIFSFGDAKFYGSTGNINLNQPIVGMTPSADGKGYWFVASDGGIFSFGDAKFAGSMASEGDPFVAGIVRT
jgi:ribosomal protein L24E